MNTPDSATTQANQPKFSAERVAIRSTVAFAVLMVAAGCSGSTPAQTTAATGGVGSSDPATTATSSGGATSKSNAAGGSKDSSSRTDSSEGGSDTKDSSGGATNTKGTKNAGGSTAKGSSSGGAEDSSGGAADSSGGSSGKKSESAGGTVGKNTTKSGTGGKAAGGSQSGGTGTGTDSGQGGSSTGGSESSGTGGSSGGDNTTPAACPSSVLKSGDQTKTVQVGTGSRSYVLHVPAKYDGTKAVPLIIDFHGITGSGSGERSSSPYPSQTDPDGVIMAFPTGASGPMGNAWNVGPCCVANVDDVAFAKAMVTEISKVACIDSKRVYAVGFSMGGGLTHYLGCHAADVFAALAPAAFDLLKENVDACKPARPLTVVSFRGTSDSIVSYAGGYSAVVSGMPITFLGAKETFAKWAELDGCTGSPSAEDGKGCSTYSTCKDGVQVTLCTKQGGSHAAGDASVAWPILKKYSLP